MVVVGGGTGGGGGGAGLGGRRVRATYHTNVWKKVHVTFKLDKLPYYDLFPVVSMDCRLLVFVKKKKKNAKGSQESIMSIYYSTIMSFYHKVKRTSKIRGRNTP